LRDWGVRCGPFPGRLAGSPPPEDTLATDEEQ